MKKYFPLKQLKRPYNNLYNNQHYFKLLVEINIFIFNSWTVDFIGNLSYCSWTDMPLQFYSFVLCLLHRPTGEYTQLILMFSFTSSLTALLSSPPSFFLSLLPYPCDVSCSCSSSFPGCVSISLLNSVLAPLMVSSPATVSHSTPPESQRESSSLSGSLYIADETLYYVVDLQWGLH